MPSAHPLASTPGPSGNSELRDVAFRDSTVRKQAGPWLIPRRRPPRPHPFPIRTPSRAPKRSRASPSCTRARTPRSRSRPAPRRRRALDAALAEIDAGAEVPSTHWRRRYSLLLGLERLLSEDEPRLADGTLLYRPPGRRAVGHADRAARRGAAQRRTAPVAAPVLAVDEEPESSLDDRRGPRRRGRRSTTTRTSDDERARGADADEDDGRRTTSTRTSPRRPTTPTPHKRFWFEHATGAGKTVAAMGFVEASRTGGILILTHRRNLVDQFHGELRDRGYGKRDPPALLDGDEDRPRRRPGHGRDLPVVRPQRRAASPTPTRSSSATRRTPRWARRPRPRSAPGPARSSSA